MAGTGNTAKAVNSQKNVQNARVATTLLPFDENGRIVQMHKFVPPPAIEQFCSNAHKFCILYFRIRRGKLLKVKGWL